MKHACAFILPRARERMTAGDGGGADSGQPKKRGTQRTERGYVGYHKNERRSAGQMAIPLVDRGRTGAGAIALAAMLSLAGCVRSDVADLKTDPGVTYEFRADKSLEASYQVAVAGFARCLTGSVLRSTLVIRPRIADDRRTARIDYYQHSFRSGYWATVDFLVVDGGTKINTYAIDNPGIRALGPVMEKWMSGSEECGGLGEFIGKRFPLIE